MDNEQTPSTRSEEAAPADFPQTIPSDQLVPDFSQPDYPQTIPSDQLVPDFSRPNFPGGSIGPVVIPIYPGGLNFAQVRFLHAAAGYRPISITIGPRTITNKLAYENLTSYTRINSGYRTITIADANNPRNIIFRKAITFTPGSQVTVAVTNAANGLQLVSISDQLCANKSNNTGCVRVVNLSYGSGSFDIVLENGETVFSDIEFKEISPFRQARRGRYRFNVYEASPGIQPRINYDPLLTFPLTVSGNEMYTIYLVGSTYSSPALSPVIVANS